MSEAELHLLAGRLQGAKRAAAARGELRTPLPVGYLHDEDGRIVIDPDEEVAGAIADVFAAFAATGSAYQVVAAFAGRRFPQRAYGGAWAGQLRWGRLNHARVLGILNNPCYAGAYVFGRYAARRSVAPGRQRALRRSPASAMADWQVLIHDHHPGYLSWEDYLANEAKIAANRTHAGARPAREGHALCQGIIGCGSCGRPMSTRYHRNGRGAYECHAANDQQATPSCRSISAEAARRRRRRTAAGRARTPKRSRSRSPPPTRSPPAAPASAAPPNWPSNAPATKPTEPSAPSTPPNQRTGSWSAPSRPAGRPSSPRSPRPRPRWPPPRRQRRHCRPAPSWKPSSRDLPGLWAAPTTTARDRKRLLRTLIADVTLLPEPDPDKLRIGMRWHTGATDEILTARPLPPGPANRTPAAAVELIRRLGPTTSNDDLVAELNAAGLRTGTRPPVRHRRRAMGPTSAQDPRAIALSRQRTQCHRCRPTPAGQHRHPLLLDQERAPHRPPGPRQPALHPMDQRRGNSMPATRRRVLTPQPPNPTHPGRKGSMRSPSRRFADRVAQTVVAMQLEADGRNRCFIQTPMATARTSRPCTRWRHVGSGAGSHDWAIDLDVQKFFDSVAVGSHRSKRCRRNAPTAVGALYVKRWLAAPLQLPDGPCTSATGEPRKGPRSRLCWRTCSCTTRSTRGWPGSYRRPFERYADDRRALRHRSPGRASGGGDQQQDGRGRPATSPDQDQGPLLQGRQRRQAPTSTLLHLPGFTFRARGGEAEPGRTSPVLARDQQHARTKATAQGSRMRMHGHTGQISTV